MNIPFPVLLPRLIDSKWFNADSPCDEEAELTVLEQGNQQWLNSIGQPYMKRAPLGKADPEPMEEEAETDEEEGTASTIFRGNDETNESAESHDEDEEEELRQSYSSNDETDESEELHDEDEEEELQQSYSPARNNNELEPDSLDDINETSELNTSDQSALWPIQ